MLITLSYVNGAPCPNCVCVCSLQVLSVIVLILVLVLVFSVSVFVIPLPLRSEIFKLVLEIFSDIEKKGIVRGY